MKLLGSRLLPGELFELELEPTFSGTSGKQYRIQVCISARENVPVKRSRLVGLKIKPKIHWTIIFNFAVVRIFYLLAVLRFSAHFRSGLLKVFYCNVHFY